MSKTQTYLQERKRKSQSQPPEKRGKEKFQFFSTSKYENLIPGSQDNKQSEHEQCDDDIRKVTDVKKGRNLNGRENFQSNFPKDLDKLTLQNISETKNVFKPKTNQRPFLQTLE